MSVFTNPASGAREAADAYIAATLGLLGAREPLDVLRETPGWLAETVGAHDTRVLTRPEAPGKWSVREVVCHLADAELVWGYRIRMVLAHDRARLDGYDQDAFADTFAYGERDIRDALTAFQAVREANVFVLERASPEAMSHVGVHAERGEESMQHTMRLEAGHDLVHRRQIDRILGVVA